MPWHRLVRLGLLNKRLQESEQAFEDALHDALKRQEAYTGVTDANGVWTVEFVPPFAEIPHVAAEVVNPDVNTQFRMTSVTQAGFSMHVFRRTVINVLGLQVPSFTTQNVAAQACTAVAFER